MSTSLGTYKLYSPALGCSVPVELFAEIGDKELTKIHKDWNNILLHQARLAKFRYDQISNPTDSHWHKILQEYGAPDYHWDWRKKAAPVNGRTTHTSFFIQADNKVQAAMMINLTRRCREPNQKDQHLAYIDFLAVAPWNRIQIQNPPQLKGLGKMMLGVAVSLSLEEGWKGRIGLHSLPQSVGFYQACNMTNLGKDSGYQNLHYYEFTPAQAENFLKSKLE